MLWAGRKGRSRFPERLFVNFVPLGIGQFIHVIGKSISSSSRSYRPRHLRPADQFSRSQQLFGGYPWFAAVRWLLYQFPDFVVLAPSLSAGRLCRSFRGGEEQVLFSLVEPYPHRKGY